MTRVILAFTRLAVKAAVAARRRLTRPRDPASQPVAHPHDAATRSYTDPRSASDDGT